jgi:hypothetical protein
MGRSLPPLLLAIATRYSRPAFLHTSETIEFILDFSTGLMTGSGKRYQSEPVQIGGVVLAGATLAQQ